MPSSALEGIEVVELCEAVAGPFTGKIFAENGARVVKVEPVYGEMLRTRNAWYDNDAHEHDDFTYRYLNYNNSKDSIGIDLKDAEGTEVLWDLLEEADVVIENMTSGTFERLGFSWEEMHERNPELIYCSITGYGEDGPYSEWPAYDSAIQGVSAWAAQNSVDGEPHRVGIIAIDHATALYASTSVLIALVERGISGEGQRIDVSMIDTAVSFFGHQFAELSAGMSDPDVMERVFTRSSDSIYRVADGYMVLIVMPEHWRSFCEAIGREEFIDDHRFSTVNGRREHADEFKATLEEDLVERTAEEWIDYLSERAPRVVCAPVNEITDLPDDPHVRSRELIRRREHPVVGEYVQPRPVMRFSRYDPIVEEAPELGADTEEILLGLDYPPEEIDRLRSENVVR